MTEQNTSIFAKISNQYSRFTASEKKVADYVLSNKEEVQYMSISELAYECHVGDATVSRFCKSLKLNGYNNFKLELAKSSVSFDPLHPGYDGKGTSVITDGGEDEISALSLSLYSSYSEALTQTIGYIKPEKFKEAVDLLYDADRVYCMGQGGSMILAQEAAHLMSTISGKFIAVQGSHIQTSVAALMDEKDVVLFFSYSGSTKDIVELMTLVKSTGARIILITRFQRSPGARLADIVLQCGSNEQPLQQGSVAAKFAQLFIIDILYQELFKRNPEASQKNLEKIAEALSDKHL